MLCRIEVANIPQNFINNIFGVHFCFSLQNVQIIMGKITNETFTLKTTLLFNKSDKQSKSFWPKRCCKYDDNDDDNGGEKDILLSINEEHDPNIQPHPQLTIIVAVKVQRKKI